MAGPGSGGAPPPRWLLIGNARWHWAASKPGGPGLLLWHTPPPGPELSTLAAGLRAWAAVGPLPEPFNAESGNAWPQATEAAMRQGVIAGLTAAVADGFLEARRDEPQLRLLLCGGDGPSLQTGLHRRLAAEGLAARLWHRPALALEALAALAPDQASSRSARI